MMIESMLNKLDSINGMIISTLESDFHQFTGAAGNLDFDEACNRQRKMEGILANNVELSKDLMAIKELLLSKRHRFEFNHLKKRIPNYSYENANEIIEQLIDKAEKT